jgi:hypothetical protein
LWSIGLEALMLTVFLVTFGEPTLRLLTTWPGVLILAVVLPLGIVAPLALRTVHARWKPAAWLGPIAILAAGFALRFAVVSSPDIFRVGL